MQIVLLIVIALGVWAIYFTIRNSHNELMKGIQSIDEKLEK